MGVAIGAVIKAAATTSQPGRALPQPPHEGSRMRGKLILPSGPCWRIGRNPPIESDFVYRSLPASLNLMRMKAVLPFGFDWEVCDRAPLARDPTFDACFSPACGQPASIVARSAECDPQSPRMFSSLPRRLPPSGRVFGQACVAGPKRRRGARHGTRRQPGFRSIRRFNDAFRATYGRPPSSSRRTAI
jgi:hypothetical protein